MATPGVQWRVRDRMAVAPYTVAPSDSLQAAIDIMRKHEVRELPVVEEGVLVGIISDRDLRQFTSSYPLYRDETELRRYTENLKVSSTMTAKPVTVAADLPLVKAAKLLHAYRVASLPVVDGQRLAGIISVTDVLQAFIELCENATEI